MTVCYTALGLTCSHSAGVRLEDADERQDGLWKAARKTPLSPLPMCSERHMHVATQY